VCLAGQRNEASARDAACQISPVADSDRRVELAIQHELCDCIGSLGGNPDGSGSAARYAEQRIATQLEIVDHRERVTHLVA
jgi:hypothetical protein